jgi:ABC-type sulfate transport system substrate-binding protein
MTLLRAGQNKTLLAWENHTQIVTGDYQTDNYAKMAIEVDIESIVSVAIVADSGHFKHINMVTEVY